MIGFGVISKVGDVVVSIIGVWVDCKPNEPNDEGNVELISS